MALRQLDYKEVARLRDEEGLSFNAIAERLDGSKSGVQKAYWKAKGQPEGKSGASQRQAPGNTRKQTYRVREEMIVQLRRRAEKTGESQSMIINRALEAFLERDE